MAGMPSNRTIGGIATKLAARRPCGIAPLAVSSTFNESNGYMGRASATIRRPVLLIRD
jgi:hypothetical protein